MWHHTNTNLYLQHIASVKCSLHHLGPAFVDASKPLGLLGKFLHTQ